MALEPIAKLLTSLEF